jgi:beta-lactam-binding protein with PASTA domain
VENGNTRPLPGCSGLSSCQRALADAGFRYVTARVDSDLPSGEFVGTSPRFRAVPGQVVTILISNGSDYVEPAPEPEPGPAPDPPARPQPPRQPPADRPPPDQGPPDGVGAGNGGGNGNGNGGGRGNGRGGG